MSSKPTSKYDFARSPKMRSNLMRLPNVPSCVSFPWKRESLILFYKGYFVYRGNLKKLRQNRITPRLCSVQGLLRLVPLSTFNAGIS